MKAGLSCRRDVILSSLYRWGELKTRGPWGTDSVGPVADQRSQCLSFWFAEGAGVGVVLVVFHAGEEVGEVGLLFGADGDGGEVGLGHGAASSRSGGGDHFGVAFDACLEGGGFFLQVVGSLVEHFEDGHKVEAGGIVFDGEVVDDHFLERC